MDYSSLQSKASANSGDSHRSSWRQMVSDVVDAATRNCTSTDDVMEGFSYALQKTYPPSRFRFIVFKIDDGEKLEIIRQSGYPVSVEELEVLLSDNHKAMRAYELTGSPRFFDDYDEASDFKQGNLFDEGKTAFIPVATSSKQYGWLVIASMSKTGVWNDDEKAWLPILGNICGGYVKTVEDNAKRFDSDVDILRSQWIDAIQSVLSESRFSSHLAIDDTEGQKHFSDSRIDPRLENLTSRELEILEQLALGITNSEISERLCISEHTTKKHIENILSKTGAKNRTQAARLLAK